MAHSLTITPPVATSISKNTRTHLPCLRFHRVKWACYKDSISKPVSVSDTNLVHRRTVTLGLAGALLGLNVAGRSANAAARRPPPPPPTEKKDPNVSGVQAKVLASKKRKEALKESIAKQKEKEKPINKPSKSKPITEPSE